MYHQPSLRNALVLLLLTPIAQMFKNLVRCGIATSLRRMTAPFTLSRSVKADCRFYPGNVCALTPYQLRSGAEPRRRLWKYAARSSGGWMVNQPNGSVQISPGRAGVVAVICLKGEKIGCGCRSLTRALHQYVTLAWFAGFDILGFGSLV
jgi:hypothetical protein